MKRFLMTAFCILGMSYYVYAQNMRELIKQMPDSVLPLLTRNNRLDMIDYLDSGMKAEISNKFGGQSEMTAIREDYVNIKLTERSSVAFKLLPFGNDNIICMVHTCKSIADDSQMKFYSVQWKQLPEESFFYRPSTDDFFVRPDTLTDLEYRNLRNKADVNFVKIDFADNSTDIVLTFTTPQYMNEEDRTVVTPYLREQIRMKWNGTKFE